MQPDQAAGELGEVIRGRARRQAVPPSEPSTSLLDGNPEDLAHSHLYLVYILSMFALEGQS